MAKRGAAKMYRLKVTLKRSTPKIWRRLEVPGDFTLGDLHAVLQVAMGWHNSHLHQFTFKTQTTHAMREEMFRNIGKGGTWDFAALRGRRDYGPAGGDMGGDETEDEDSVTLAEVAPAEKMKFVYEYDFGDSWEHEILVEKITDPQPGAAYPYCLKAAGRCPPEDCGGVWDYAELLAILADPKHPENEERREWLGLNEGEKYDAEAFDIDAVNKRLSRK